MGEWPISDRIITLDANPDVILYQARHGAIIERRDAQKWLDFTVSEADLLMTPPAGIFKIEEILTKPVQTSMMF